MLSRLAKPLQPSYLVFPHLLSTRVSTDTATTGLSASIANLLVLLIVAVYRLLLAVCVLALLPAVSWAQSVRVVSSDDGGEQLEFTFDWPRSLAADLDSSGATTFDQRALELLSGGALDGYHLLRLPTAALPTVRVIASDYDAVALPLALADSLMPRSARPIDVGIARREPVATLAVPRIGYSGGEVRRYRRVVVDVRYASPRSASAFDRSSRTSVQTTSELSSRHHLSPAHRRRAVSTASTPSCCSAWASIRRRRTRTTCASSTTAALRCPRSSATIVRSIWSPIPSGCAAAATARLLRVTPSCSTRRGRRRGSTAGRTGSTRPTRTRGRVSSFSKSAPRLSAFRRSRFRPTAQRTGRRRRAASSSTAKSFRGPRREGPVCSASPTCSTPGRGSTWPTPTICPAIRAVRSRGARRLPSGRSADRPAPSFACRRDRPSCCRAARVRSARDLRARWR